MSAKPLKPGERVIVFTTTKPRTYMAVGTVLRDPDIAGAAMIELDDEDSTLVFRHAHEVRRA